jgi:hypothetical protein
VLATSILGIEIPDAGAVFYAALIVHILAGVTCVIAVRWQRPPRSAQGGIRDPAGCTCGASALCSSRRQ